MQCFFMHGFFMGIALRKSDQQQCVLNVSHTKYSPSTTYITDCTIVDVLSESDQFLFDYGRLGILSSKACKQTQPSLSATVHMSSCAYNSCKSSFQLCMCSFLVVSLMPLWWSTLH